MRSPFRKPKHDPAALLLAPGLGFYRRGLGGVSGAPSAMAGAIAQAEGYGIAGAIPTVANNPGDLVSGDIGYGTIQGKTIFPSAAAGWGALQNQVNLITSGKSTAGYTPTMTIAQVSNLYSGSSNGNWGNNVASILGVTPDTSFAAAASGSASAPVPVPVDYTLATATPSTDGSDVSLSDLLGLSITDNTPYIIASVVSLAALAYSIS